MLDVTRHCQVHCSVIRVEQYTGLQVITFTVQLAALCIVLLDYSTTVISRDYFFTV